MSKTMDLTGHRYGKLTAIRYIGNIKSVGAGCYWECLCDCGKTTVTSRKHLRSGTTTSCGCNLVERGKKGIRTTHNMRNTRIYNIWSKLKSRCLNPKDKLYKYYGGRGITVCDKWLTFEGFWEDMQEGYSDELTIDRMDVNGNYENPNCRWATMKEQNRNRRTTRYLTYSGETKSVAYFAEKYNIDLGVLYWRLNKDWAIEKALNIQ
jgi:hypothetical protein